MWPAEVHVKLGFFLTYSSRLGRNSSLKGGDSSLNNQSMASTISVASSWNVPPANDEIADVRRV
jgi:hypothetical protein